MSLDHRPGRPVPPRRQHRRPSDRDVARRLLGTTAVLLAVVVVISVSLLVKESFGRTDQKAVALEVKPVQALKPTQPPRPRLTGIPKGYKLSFNAGFSGTALDTSVWSTCYWWSPGGCTNNPSKEREWYLPSQVQVSGGALHLTAKHEPTQGLSSKGKPMTYTCRSGMVTSAPGINFQYGLIQVVARVPYGTGLWPALWLSASDHQWPPELDIMEHWHTQAQAKVYDHPVGGHYFGGAVYTPGNLSTGWHTFSLLWTKSSVTWYIDSYQVYSTKKLIPRQDMYLTANVADDSTAASSCNGTLMIKSVKVWQA